MVDSSASARVVGEWYFWLLRLACGSVAIPSARVPVRVDAYVGTSREYDPIAQHPRPVLLSGPGIAAVAPQKLALAIEPASRERRHHHAVAAHV